jgi:hypothetical protein
MPADAGDLFYLREIEVQCEFRIRSFGQMQEVFASHPQHPSLLALSHTLLVFAGNVVKLLTATSESTSKTKARAKRLRDLLGFNVADFNEIRRARNFFEHFDERIDRYLFKQDGLLVHRMVLDHEPEKITLDDGRKFLPKYLQFLNTHTLELILYGERFPLSKIVRLLEKIQSKAQSHLEETTTK